MKYPFLYTETVSHEQWWLRVGARGASPLFDPLHGSQWLVAALWPTECGGLPPQKSLCAIVIHIDYCYLHCHHTLPYEMRCRRSKDERLFLTSVDHVCEETMDGVGSMASQERVEVLPSTVKFFVCQNGPWLQSSLNCPRLSNPLFTCHWGTLFREEDCSVWICTLTLCSSLHNS